MAFSVDSALHRWKRLAGDRTSPAVSESTPLLGTSKKSLLLHTLDKQRVIYPNNRLRQTDWQIFSRYYRGNAIHTTKYSLLTFLPKNLVEQFYRFANLYFLSLAVLNWMPQLEVFHKEITMIPLAIVLGIIAIKDGLEDYKRYQVDRKINSLKTTVYRKRGYCCFSEYTWRLDLAEYSPEVALIGTLRPEDSASSPPNTPCAASFLILLPVGSPSLKCPPRRPEISILSGYLQEGSESPPFFRWRASLATNS